MVNTSSIRTKSNDFLYCFQCLYQNKAITVEEKNRLTEALKELLADENSNTSRKNLRIMLEDIFYGKDLPMFLKQMVENIMYVV